MAIRSFGYVIVNYVAMYVTKIIYFYLSTRIVAKLIRMEPAEGSDIWCILLLLFIIYL